MAITFLAQLGSIFTALEVRSNIENNKGDAGIQKEFPLYDTDSGIKAKWDDLHRDLHCCGGYRYDQGYTDWVGKLQNKPNGTVPDSCCQTYSEGCGISVANGNPDFIRGRIFVNGCMEIIEDKLKDDVVPMMIVYTCLGVILAIVELISLVLACVYVAQIRRGTSKYHITEPLPARGGIQKERSILGGKLQKSA